MSPRAPRRSWIVLVTSAAAIVAAGAWLSHQRTSPPPPGALLYELRCSGCHDARDVAAMVQASPDRQVERRQLETFLSTHTVSPAADNRVIVDYLLLESAR